MTSTSRQPGRQEATISGLRIACQTRWRGAAMEKRSSIRMLACVLARFPLDNHRRVDKPTPLDHDLVVENNGTIPHRDVVVPTGGALSAALGGGPGREQEVPRKSRSRGTAAFGLIAIERNTVPQGLRIQAPAEMRYRERIAVVGRGLVIGQPVPHQLRVQTALDLGNKAIANIEPNGVLNVATIGKDDDIARLEHDRSGGGPLIGEGVDVPSSPMIEMAGFVGIAPLTHDRIFATGVGEVGSGIADNVNLLGLAEPLLGVLDRLLETF